jgi:general secretion pathway protein K
MNKMALAEFKKSFHDISSQKGIALLMVLWILTILMVIVLSFSFTAKTETYATLAFKGGSERKFIAEAGIERSIMELFYRDMFRNAPVELEGREVWRTDGRPYKGELGSGYYLVSITEESGKVDINMASDLLLKNLLINAGVQEEEVDIIVDSIMDWKDEDNLHRLYGVESDYYMSLPIPYKAKDADFDTIEELLLVKGMTPDILYGNNNRKGIIDFITVHSQTDKININAAPKEVLLAVPGVTPEIADAIINARQVKEISGEEIQGLIAGGFETMSSYIKTTGTNQFTIDSSGYQGTEKGSYVIRATVIVSSSFNNYNFVYYKSPVYAKQ